MRVNHQTFFFLAVLSIIRIIFLPCARLYSLMLRGCWVPQFKLGVGRCLYLLHPIKKKNIHYRKDLDKCRSFRGAGDARVSAALPQLPARHSKMRLCTLWRLCCLPFFFPQKNRSHDATSQLISGTNAQWMSGKHLACASNPLCHPPSRVMLLQGSTIVLFDAIFCNSSGFI